MGWGSIKKSMENAIKDTMESDEFKSVIKKAVVEVVDEGSELIDKIVPNDDHDCKEDK